MRESKIGMAEDVHEMAEHRRPLRWQRVMPERTVTQRVRKTW